MKAGPDTPCPKPGHTSGRRLIEGRWWACRDCRAEATRNSPSQRDPERNHRASREFRARNPEKQRAWWAVSNAVRSGRLVRPKNCQRCGKACHPQASHDDYSKPLDVEWLCAMCHNEKDAATRRAV
jgi:hypothetical protein